MRSGSRRLLCALALVAMLALATLPAARAEEDEQEARYLEDAEDANSVESDTGEEFLADDSGLDAAAGAVDGGSNQGDLGSGEGEDEDDDGFPYDSSSSSGEDDGASSKASRRYNGGGGASSVGSPHQPGFCRQAGAPLVPTLEVERVWESARERNATDVTLVTQLSIERLYMLEGQCSTWGSVIAASVHVPLVGGKVVSDLAELHGGKMDGPERVMAEFHSRMEAEGRCKLDYVLASEEVGSLELVGLYPVNALRNLALQLAKTEIVLLLDADFLPNLGLTDMLHQPEVYEQLRRVTSYKQAIVLPAFETVEDGDLGKEAALEAVQGREALKVLFSKGELQGFHMAKYSRGHRATDYSKWFSTWLAYRIHYEEGYEPYVLVQRQFVPWYDERFKGYRKNKVVHLMHMFRLGLHFVATPHGYVVHAPHPVANSWNITRSSGFWWKLKKLYAEVRTDMAATTFVPITGFECDSNEAEKWSFYRRLLFWRR